MPQALFLCILLLNQPAHLRTHEQTAFRLGRDQQNKIEQVSGWVAAAGVQRLTQLSQLQGLDLSMTSVTSNGLAGLSQLQNLRSLQLSSCLLTMPSALKAVLLSFPHLTCLDLSETRCVFDQLASAGHALDHITLASQSH